MHQNVCKNENPVSRGGDLQIPRFARDDND